MGGWTRPPWRRSPPPAQRAGRAHSRRAVHRAPLPLPVTFAAARPTRAPVCRRGGCSAPATDDGLCEDHLLAQKRLRAGVEGMPPPAWSAPTGPAWLVELAAAREAPWRSRAACRGLTALMFPDVEHGIVDYGPALALCASCPVVEPCRQAGSHERFGVWGASPPPARRHPRR